MYILTEEKLSIDTSEKVRVRAGSTASGPKFENKFKYGSPYVKPWEDSIGSFDGKWALCIDELHSSDEQSVICIAVFDTVYKANLALQSVRKAKEANKGWDAEAYKKSENKAP